MRRFVCVGAAAVLTLGMFTGCAVSPEAGEVDESLDVYDAKQVAQEMENELVAFIPEASVVSVEQAEKSGLLGCEGDGVFRWAGHSYVLLVGELDSEPIVDAVAEEFSRRQSFTAERDTTDDGVPRVRVRGPGASSYSMALSVDRTRVEVLSFSPCFRLADDLDSRDKY